MTGDVVLMSSPDGYEVYGGKADGVYIIAEQDGPVVGAFYAMSGSSGWWHGHAFGKPRKLWQPGNPDPLTLAERFLRR
ncbi:hypothetical protein [Actinomadura decatromicini]|uniref:Uncharacterized protein n=1 Tax=Actinomadura decatromicini TaxID=2604572 RepID=A0A5D3FGJ2_9ACTN|nr:hypothetical protein [Actinomadura decatromicini]TYK47144.1 hypothetical protein FXF68_25410 [Actinomadura decatromicini]